MHRHTYTAARNPSYYWRKVSGWLIESCQQLSNESWLEFDLRWSRPENVHICSLLLSPAPELSIPYCVGSDAVIAYFRSYWFILINHLVSRSVVHKYQYNMMGFVIWEPVLPITSRTQYWFQSSDFPQTSQNISCPGQKEQGEVFRRMDDHKFKQTEARDLPISPPKFRWLSWAWIWVYSVALMTNTLHNLSLHTGPGDPWSVFSVFSAVFFGLSLCWWKDESHWGQTEAAATWSEAEGWLCIDDHSFITICGQRHYDHHVFRSTFHDHRPVKPMPMCSTIRPCLSISEVFLSFKSLRTLLFLPDLCFI